MVKRNPFEPPGSNLEPLPRQPGEVASFAGDDEPKALLYRVTTAVAVVWVALSPIVWWINLSRGYGIQMQAEFILQPVALAVLGFASLPFLWRQSIRAAVLLVAGVVAVALSTFVFPTLLRDGTLLNAGLLSVVGVVAGVRSAKSLRAKREA